MASFITIASSRSAGSVTRRSAMSCAEARTGTRAGSSGSWSSMAWDGSAQMTVARGGGQPRGVQAGAAADVGDDLPGPDGGAVEDAPGHPGDVGAGCRPSSRRSWRPAGRSGPGCRRRGCWSWCSWRFSSTVDGEVEAGHVRPHDEPGQLVGRRRPGRSWCARRPAPRCRAAAAGAFPRRRSPGGPSRFPRTGHAWPRSSRMPWMP